MQDDINLALLLDPVNSKLSAELVTKNKGLCWLLFYDVAFGGGRLLGDIFLELHCS